MLTCRYLLDDEAETAAVLGWPRGTVKSRTHRGLRQLAEVLAEPSTDPAATTGPASSAGGGTAWVSTSTTS